MFFISIYYARFHAFSAVHCGSFYDVSLIANEYTSPTPLANSVFSIAFRQNLDWDFPKVDDERDESNR